MNPESDNVPVPANIGLALEGSNQTSTIEFNPDNKIANVAGSQQEKLRALKPFGLRVDLSEEQMKISEAYNAPMSSRHALQSL